jgi:transposase
MRFVPVKSCQSQAEAVVLKQRALLVGQRTQLVNALRGHATEFGLVAARGTENVGPLLARIAAEEAMPTLAVSCVPNLVATSPGLTSGSP